MSVQPLRQADGWIVLRDARFSPDEVLEEALRYQEAVQARDDDWDNGRVDHHARWTEPAAQLAGWHLETVASPRIPWQEAETLARRLLEAARDARAAEEAAKATEAAQAAQVARQEQRGQSCGHTESLYGRCTYCGMTWGEQEAQRNAR